MGDVIKFERAFNLEKVVRQWKKDYGTPAKSKKWNAEYLKIPIGERYELLKILVKRIKDHGKEQEYFTGETQRKIIEACIPIEKSVPASYKAWVSGTRDHLEQAVVDVYCDDEPVEDYKKEEPPEVYEEFVPSNSDSMKSNDEVDPELAEILGYNKKDE